MFLTLTCSLSVKLSLALFLPPFLYLADAHAPQWPEIWMETYFSGRMLCYVTCVIWHDRSLRKGSDQSPPSGRDCIHYGLFGFWSLLGFDLVYFKCGNVEIKYNQTKKFKSPLLYMWIMNNKEIIPSVDSQGFQHSLTVLHHVIDM